MPLLSALDLIEGRGLPRLISLLSQFEAETLDHCEQIEQQCTTTFTRGVSTDEGSLLAMSREHRKMAPRQEDARRVLSGKAHYALRHHSRSWNGCHSIRKSFTRSTAGAPPRAWANAISAMGELRRVSPYQPSSAPMQKLARGNKNTGVHCFPDDVGFLDEPAQARGLNKTDCTKFGKSLGSPAVGGAGGGRASGIVKAERSGKHSQATANLAGLRVHKRQNSPATEEDLCAEIETWAWSQAYHISSPDIALILWSLAAVKSTNKNLTRDLTIRANALANSFTPEQMAMIWRALADLGETPALAVVGEIVEQVKEIAATFTPRHAKQTVASMRKCGVYDEFVFAALNRLSETVE